MLIIIMAPKQKTTDDVPEEGHGVDADFQDSVNKRFENIEQLLEALKSYCPAIRDQVAKPKEKPTLESLNARIQILEDAANLDDVLRTEIENGPCSLVTPGSNSTYSYVDAISTCLFVLFAVVWYRHVFRQG